MSKTVLLLIEDELSVRRFLKNALQAHPFQLLEAFTGQEGLTLTETHLPDLILLDLGLPDIDGLEVLCRLRKWISIPIIVLSARGQEQDKVTALDAGADDYLTKPFVVGELLARIRACLRRSPLLTEDGGKESIFETGGLRVDLVKRQVFLDQQEVRLTPIEYRLLCELIRHAGKVLTHRHLLKEVWSVRNPDQLHYVRIYVHQLRQKIEKNPVRPLYLLSEPGVGYRLAFEHSC